MAEHTANLLNSSKCSVLVRHSKHYKLACSCPASTVLARSSVLPVQPVHGALQVSELQGTGDQLAQARLTLVHPLPNTRYYPPSLPPFNRPPTGVSWSERARRGPAGR